MDDPPQTPPVEWVESAYVRYQRAMMAVALRYAPSEDEAADIVHEAWLKILRVSDPPEQAATCSHLCGVVANIGRSLVRKRRRRRELLLEYRLGRHRVTQPHRSVFLANRLLEALGRLPPRQQAVVRMRLIEDASTRRTAQELDVSEGTVKTLLYRATQSLQRDLASYHKDLVRRGGATARSSLNA